MSEERLKEIKDSIYIAHRLNCDPAISMDFRDKEDLYNEVVRLRKLFYKTIHCIKNFDYFEGEIRDDLEPMPFKYVMEEDIDYLLKKLEENNLTLEQLTGVENA